MKDIKLWAGVIVSAAVLLFGVSLWRDVHETIAAGKTEEAKPANEVKGIIREPVEVKQVQAYKPEAKKKLNLPKDIQEDRKKAVLSATQVKADIRPTVVTDVLDVETGEVKTYVTRKPLPWAAIDRRGEIGFIYGFRNGQKTVRVEVRQALFDVKALKVGGVVSYDQPLNGERGDSFIGIGVWYRW